ncbi:unnamed protein product [Cyclocybe aegerita]|uniref:Uncharacterized protein n=1 Tax=Cyclocybe aegerita TaxID=1973307 RepID=A0A8S0WNI0_CYCAE|nr:unnamed protein product [Cyclocybe aegerita]
MLTVGILVRQDDGGAYHSRLWAAHHLGGLKFPPHTSHLIMAEIGGATIGGVASIAAALYMSAAGFSARHDQCHDSQVADTQLLAKSFEKAYRDGDLSDEDYSKYLELRSVAIASAWEYRNTIRSYKDTSPLNFLKKRRRRKDVRERKEQTCLTNQKLLDHYYFASSGSDASSITAASGSPPGSGLENENIRDWIADVDTWEECRELSDNNSDSDSDSNFSECGVDDEASHACQEFMKEFTPSLHSQTPNTGEDRSTFYYANNQPHFLTDQDGRGKPGLVFSDQDSVSEQSVFDFSDTVALSLIEEEHVQDHAASWETPILHANQCLEDVFSSQRKSKEDSCLADWDSRFADWDPDFAEPGSSTHCLEISRQNAWAAYQHDRVALAESARIFYATCIHWLECYIVSKRGAPEPENSLASLESAVQLYKERLECLAERRRELED